MPSTVIERFDYDEAHARLTVVFTTGRVYQYSLVPASLAADFRLALSKGAFFNRHIRDKYPCREIAAQKAPALPSNLLDQLKRSAE